jgi:hypothetical protein
MVKVQLNRSGTSVFGNLDRLPILNKLYWPPSTPLQEDHMMDQSPDRTSRADNYYLLYKMLSSVPSITILFALFVVIDNTIDIPFYMGTVIVVVNLIAAALGIRFKDRYIRLSKVSAQKLVRLDLRPPVLILRTYSDDSRGTPDRGLLETDDPAAKVGYQLNSKLSLYGPVITLENSSLNIPILGPSTKRISNEAWQQEVLLDIERAGLIIIIAGLGRWLLWELNQIVERGLLYRTILIIPPYFGDKDIGGLKTMAKDFKLLDGDISKAPAHFQNFASQLLNLKALCDRAEFEDIRNIAIDNTLIIRWSIEGEAITIQDSPRTFKGILQALDLCVLMSGLRTYEPALHIKHKPLE